MLREPATGRPAPLARLVALVTAIALAGTAGLVVLFPVVHWVLDLL